MSRSYKHTPNIMTWTTVGRGEGRWWCRYRRHVDRTRARAALAREDYDTPRHDLGRRFRPYDPGDGKSWHALDPFRMPVWHTQAGTVTWTWVSAEERLRKARRK